MISKQELNLKKSKPITSSLRHRVWYDSSKFLARAKNLSLHIKKRAGRNNFGKITVRSKKNYSNKYKTFFANSFYTSSLKGSILSIEGVSLDRNKYKPFYVYKNLYGSMFQFPGTFLANKIKFLSESNFISFEKQGLLKQGVYFNLGEKGSFAEGSKYTRFAVASGSSFTVVLKKKEKVVVKLPSGKLKTFSVNNFFKEGRVFFQKKNQIQLGSAGFGFKILGKKSSVRGVAKNPVDHPHGGGEGKKSGLKKSPQGYYNGIKK